MFGLWKVRTYKVEYYDDTYKLVSSEIYKSRFDDIEQVRMMIAKYVIGREWGPRFETVGDVTRALRRPIVDSVRITEEKG